MGMSGDKIKVLITGANGFIGSHLLDHLIEDGNYKIGITLRTFSDTWRIKRHIDNLEIFYIDKIDIEDIISKFKPELVIHLAVYYRKEHSYSDIEEMLNTNIIFPTKILDSMVRNNIKFFINTGTFTEYSINESELKPYSKLSPSNLYSATKVSFEDILKFYTNNYEINAITLKLFAPYGYRDNPKKLIPYLINCALKGEIAEISPGDQRWDFIYVKDIAKAYIKGIKYLMKTREKYSVFNIGSGTSHSIKEIVEIINSFGKKLQVKWGAKPYSKMETFYVKADITSSINILEWWPEYSLRDGLLETYEWYKREINNER